MSAVRTVIIHAIKKIRINKGYIMVENKDAKSTLFYERKNVWKEVGLDSYDLVNGFSEDYKRFLDECKTERECIRYIHKFCEDHAFISLKSAFKKKQDLHPGDKLYYEENGKTVLLAIIGKEGLSQGLKIIGSHIDAPRLDLKPLPVFEDTELGYLKTHYYGGVKKYQWVNIPMALHGVIYKNDGTQIEINVGESDDDPIFVIPDLLPHLSAEQNKLTLKEAIPGESLNILVGSVPYTETESAEKVKYTVLSLLFKKYGITEKDFINAELEVVPALKARDVGFDASIVGAYGHDDRVCAYTSLKAFAEVGNSLPDKTCYCYFSDKEEIGSNGNTGAQCDLITYVTEMISALLDVSATKEKLNLNIKSVMRDSVMLSADVTAAFDPNHKGQFEANNSTYINRGIAIAKYTGSGGKGGASDANCEFVNSITKLFDQSDVIWQIGELGKIDAGGGGTIAKFAAQLGINVLDAGVPLLSMHAPYELAGKADIYMSYKAFKTFYINL